MSSGACAGAWSGRSSYSLELDVQSANDDVANNRSAYNWQLYLTGSGTSYTLEQAPWNVAINGQQFSGTHTLDGRSTPVLLASGTTGFFGHDSNGDLYVSFSASGSAASIFGSASCAGAMFGDRLPRPPGAPSGLSIGAGSVSTNNFRVNYTRGASNGQTLNRDTAQWATDSGFSNIIWTDNNATGSSNPSGSGITLNAGTTYYVRVRASSPGGTSAWSPTISQQTLYNIPGPPSTPTLVAGSVTTTNFQVTYARGAANGATLYADTVQFSTVPDFSSIAWTDNNATGTSQPLGNYSLTPGTTYYVRARSNSAGGSSSWSGTFSQATPYPIPGPPSTPTVVSGTVTPTNFHISYVRGTGNGGTLYNDTVQWATDPGFSNIVFTDSATGTSDPATGSVTLNPGTTYYVRAESNSVGGTSSWSGTLTQATLPSGPPTLSVVTQVKGLSATLTLTAPSSVSGVSQFDVYQRVTGTTSPVAHLVTATSPYTLSGLTPGVSYDYQVTATIGSYTSPASSWVTAVQPNPNTSPGAYFDGSTAPTTDRTYAWLGTAGKSASVANGKAVTGWRSFAEASSTSGGTGAISRTTVSAIGLISSARALFWSDTTAAGFFMGLSSSAVGRTSVNELSNYWASMSMIPSRSQNMRVGIGWYTAAGGYLSTSWGTASVIPGNVTSRLNAFVSSPAGAAYASLVASDTTGTGWSTWKAGDTLVADLGMITLNTLFPYFDGDSTSTAQYAYSWLGAVQASQSTRVTSLTYQPNPLLDPTAPVIAAAPVVPVINDGALTVINTWRRYWFTLPQIEISNWLTMLPTIYVTTGNQEARQTRVRIYANPNNLAPSAFATADWVAEQIISYLPANTTIMLDAVSKRAWATLLSGVQVAADYLLYGSSGQPASWPVLGCGIAYLVSLDAPVTSDPSNLSLQIQLTRRY